MEVVVHAIIISLIKIFSWLKNMQLSTATTVIACSILIREKNSIGRKLLILQKAAHSMEKQLSFLSKALETVTKKSHSSKTLPHHSSGSVYIFIDGASRGNPGPAGAGIYGLYNDKELIAEGIY